MSIKTAFGFSKLNKYDVCLGFGFQEINLELEISLFLTLLQHILSRNLI